MIDISWMETLQYTTVNGGDHVILCLVRMLKFLQKSKSIRYGTCISMIMIRTSDTDEEMPR